MPLENNDPTPTNDLTVSSMATVPHHQRSNTSRLRRLRNLAGMAMAQYDIPNAHLSYLQEGDNLLYRVTAPAQGQFLLRVHSPARYNESEIRSELLWLAALRCESRLPVPEPMFTRDGSPVCEVSIAGIPDARCCVLLRWIPGRRKRASLGTADVKLMGAYIARLHQHAEQWTPPADFIRARWDWEHLFGPQSPIWTAGTKVYQEDELQCFAAAAHRIKADLRDLGDGSDTFGVIHSDLNPSNFVFREGAAYAIDFEECVWGYYLYDITVTLSELKKNGDRYEQLREALLDGYQQVRPLADSYERYRETFEVMRAVELVHWILDWESPTFRAWGLSHLAYAVTTLKKFLD